MVGRMHALGGPYPSEFPYRSKAVVAFQQRDGIDVRYFESQPGGQRTLVRTLGFKWVHIWVEPPKAGDEYIFFARPDQHKRPMKRDKLRAW
ncbi:hypothetical protein T492DRAFT_874749 [Pavlovales sp. CCMP2436]|nr:hypothetical protein T492DRAFT_874749 [Pavlovales sp. CCMP2436]